MNFFKRFVYRVLREFYRIKNKRYINLYIVESKNKKKFLPKITNTCTFIDSHIPDLKFPLPNIINQRSLVIHIPYGGLGDHLLYSHIPRLAKETGAYTKVYFSLQSKIRNENHLEFIWRKNPYLDGFCNEPSYHDYNSMNIASFDLEKSNILDQIMLSYGIDDGKRWHDPELFFKVPLISELYGKSVYDPNFISYSGGLSSKKIENFFYANNKKIDFQFPIRSSLSLPIIQFDSFIKDASFEEFCSVLISCKELYTLTTGTATLAAALRKSATVFHGKQIDNYFLHSKSHTYILI